jgi:hypothetical protein
VCSRRYSVGPFITFLPWYWLIFKIFLSIVYFFTLIT